MKHPWKIWTKFGNLSKGVNRHNFIKIYFTVGFIVLIGGFIGFSQILIKNIREDSRKAPSLFARYIFNTKSYLDEAQVNYQAVITNIDAVNKNYEQANDNSKLLAEIFTLWVNSLSDVRGEEKLREYFASEFAQSLTFPIILTDENNRPLTWKNCSIMETEYSYLRKTSQDSLKALLGKMEKIDVKIQGKVLNSIHYLPMTNSLKKPPVPPLDFEDFIKNMSQPIIITDQNNTPVIWNNIIGVPNYVEYFKLSFNFKDQLTRAINEMSAIPVSSELHSNIKNIYVSPIVSIDNMNIFMILQFVLVIVFVLFGMLGIKLIRRTENDLIWVGLAKETAHQLGTPITSLLGWIEYLKIKEEFEDQENQEMLKQMESDVTHLGGIASRFGKIGSHMKLEPLELNPIIENTVDYIKIRLPHLGSKIELRLDSTIGRTVIKTEKELLSWVLENLLKNCIDAMDIKGGKISVKASVRGENVVLIIADNGKGIEKHLIKKIFEAGVTTKKRGWGLGLSLVRRIIVDYHKGKIRVVKSVVNQGTIFEILLPIYQGEREC